MDIKEIEARMAEITEEIKTADMAKLDELNSEIEKLQEQRKAHEQIVEKREDLIKAALQGQGKPAEERKELNTVMEDFNRKSPEFRSAYFKKLAGETLTDVEERAYTHTTANFGGALPIETVTQIWSNIEEEHPILGDITLYRTGTVLELSVHTAIAAGDAATKNQGVAATDEENTFVKVTLSGKDFGKTVYVSYALGKMSGGALEAYLVKEISDRLGAALAADIIAQIVADTAAGNKKNSANVKVTTYAELNSIFALVKAKGLAVYANSSTIYNYLTSIVDTTGRPVYQPSAQAGIQGFLIGAPVKAEDACSDNLFYIGAPKKIVGNLVQDILIEADRDIAKHVDVYSGYARFECKLTKDTAFAILTIKQA